MLKASAITFTLAIFLMAQVAYADHLPNPGILPDNPFYGLKKAFEGLGTVFTFDQVAKAERYVKLAETRLAEADQMVEKGKPEFVSQLTSEYEDNLQRANEISVAAQGVGRNVTRVRELVALATSVHQDVLRDILERVPDEAKPAIERALENSKKGQEEALSRLGEESPERSAALYAQVAWDRLEAARERANQGDIEDAEELIKEYEEKINRSAEMADRAVAAGRNTDVVETVTEATSRHITVLKEILDIVPEQAKPAIRRAINVSSTGQEKAIDALQRVSPESAQQIESAIPQDVRSIVEEGRRAASGETAQTGAQQPAAQPATQGPRSYR